MNQKQASAEGVYQRVLMIWVAFLCSISLLGLVTYFIARDEGNGNTTAILPLGVLSLALVASSILLRKRALARAASVGEVMKVQQAYVLAFALSEAASVMGVVARFLTGEKWAYLLIGVGALALLLNRPRRGAVQEAAAAGR